MANDCTGNIKDDDNYTGFNSVGRVIQRPAKPLHFNGIWTIMTCLVLMHGKFIPSVLLSVISERKSLSFC